jgi:hypothetical protein
LSRRWSVNHWKPFRRHSTLKNNINTVDDLKSESREPVIAQDRISRRHNPPTYCLERGLRQVHDAGNDKHSETASKKSEISEIQHTTHKTNTNHTTVEVSNARWVSTHSRHAHRLCGVIFVEALVREAQKARPPSLHTQKQHKHSRNL